MDDDAFEEALESILPAGESPAAAAAAAAAGSAGRNGNGELSAADAEVLDELLGVAPGERASGPAAGQRPAPAPVTAGSEPAQPRSASPVKPAPSEYERQWAAFKQGAEPGGSGPSLMSAIFCCFRGATQVVQEDSSRNSTGWPTLPASLLLRIGTEAGVGAWRWRIVCRQWKETLGTAPRIVRVQDLPLEELAGQIHFLIEFGRADWRLEVRETRLFLASFWPLFGLSCCLCCQRLQSWSRETPLFGLSCCLLLSAYVHGCGGQAMGDKGAAGVAAALRANEELCLVGVYRGRRKESVVGIRGASKLAIEINRGARLRELELNGSAIKQLGAEKLGRALVRQAEREGGCCLTRLGLAREPPRYRCHHLGCILLKTAAISFVDRERDRRRRAGRDRGGRGSHQVGHCYT
eukprot:COSAG04_NODE_2271_length_4415_cov_2.914736_2_plen_409_part_00